MIWKPIERARAELYLAYYKAVYRQAQSQNIDMQSMTLMFSEQGIIDSDKRCKPLPDPKSLQIPVRDYLFSEA